MRHNPRLITVEDVPHTSTVVLAAWLRASLTTLPADTATAIERELDRRAEERIPPAG